MVKSVLLSSAATPARTYIPLVLLLVLVYMCPHTAVCVLYSSVSSKEIGKEALLHIMSIKESGNEALVVKRLVKKV